MWSPDYIGRLPVIPTRSGRVQAPIWKEYMNYYVYVLESEADKSYYIGYTQGLEKRIQDHNDRRGRYTAKKRP